VRLIETDLTLASKCLQMVNSPIFGLKAKIGTIQRAVVLLGANTVANIALQTGMSKVFKEDLLGYNSTKEDLWQHGLRTAIASRLVAERLLGKENNGVAYAAGLLHDIGKVIISNYLEHNDVTNLSPDSPQDNFLKVEFNALGIDHAKVGAMVAEKWNLPEPIRAVILHHHRPSESPESFTDLAFAVHMGDLFAMMAGSNTQLDGMAYPIDPIAETYVKRDATWEIETFPRLLLDIDTEFRKAIKLSGSLGGNDV
jgi:putative nucleotidyltransferase with HDIG domain